MADESNNSGIGQRGPPNVGSPFNQHEFHIDQKLGELHTMIPVKVIEVVGGGVGPAPKVHVKPLVNMVDGAGNSQEHETIYDIQTHRGQGGGNVVINDPVVGDVGHIIVSHRDISGVLSGGDTANPGSGRRFSLSDSIYHGSLGLGNQQADSTPKQYIQFKGTDGIKIVDSNGSTIETGGGTMTLTATKIVLNGECHIGGSGGVPAAKQGTVDTGGFSDVSNLATKVFVT